MQPAPVLLARFVTLGQRVAAGTLLLSMGSIQRYIPPADRTFCLAAAQASHTI